MLLVGAGLFLRSFQQVQSVDPGFGRGADRPDDLPSLALATRFAPDEAGVYTRRLLVPALPGIEAVGASAHRPTCQLLTLDDAAFLLNPLLGGQAGYSSGIDAGRAASVRRRGREFASRHRRKPRRLSRFRP